MVIPFSYTCDKSIEVYEESKKYIGTSGYQDKIANLAWVYHSVGDLTPHTTENYWSGHFFPWVESWNEIQISFNLCMFGFYKQAMVALRSSLELGLLSVYWNLNDDGHKIIQDWLKSKEDTPYFRGIWKKLEQHPNFRLFQQKHDIRMRIQNLGSLHDYTHTKGRDFSNVGLSKAFSQKFEKNSFEIWFGTFEEVIKVTSILHLIKQPIGVIRFDYSKKFGIDTPSFGGLDEYKVDRLETIIGKDIFSAIESIAQSDIKVKDVMEWLSNLPDMTDEDVNEQIIEFDKMTIQGQGLEQWLEMEKEIYGDRIEKDEAYRNRVNLLIEWAKENGFEKSIMERYIPPEENK
jgi:hypothetical protein